MNKSRHRRAGPNRKSSKQARPAKKWSRNPVLLGGAAGMLLLAAVGVVALLLSGPEIPAFDGRRSLRDIQRLIDFGPRVPETAPHDDARAFIRSRLDSLADRVSFQPVSLVLPGADTVGGTNIVASFNLRPARNVRVMLGAHWDSRPHADRDPNPDNRALPVPGANDGASGTAVLLEVARLLHSHPPDIGVDMVFFDLEDLGRDSTVAFAAGSDQFAAANGDYHPTFGIVLDMVCDKDLRLPKETSSVQAARHVVDLVWKAARDEGAEAFKNQLGGAVTDDHIPFLKRGIPVIDVIQSPFPAYWHTVADTPDKCSASSLEEVGRVVTRVLYTL